MTERLSEEKKMDREKKKIYLIKDRKIEIEMKYFCFVNFFLETGEL